MDDLKEMLEEYGEYKTKAVKKAIEIFESLAEEDDDLDFIDEVIMVLNEITDLMFEALEEDEEDDEYYEDDEE